MYKKPYNILLSTAEILIYDRDEQLNLNRALLDTEADFILLLKSCIKIEIRYTAYFFTCNRSMKHPEESQRKITTT